jgi:hypothetical protein
MIKIKQSKTADSRTCDFSKIEKETLLASSKQHIMDVGKGMTFFIDMMEDAVNKHDHDKFSNIDQFYSDFVGGWKETTWFDNHVKVNRHHLLIPEGVPKDVNLIDVLEMIVDCVMAGMGRSGKVYDLDIDQDVLMKAFHNTVKLLKSEVVVEKDGE